MTKTAEEFRSEKKKMMVLLSTLGTPGNRPRDLEKKENEEKAALEEKEAVQVEQTPKTATETEKNDASKTERPKRRVRPDNLKRTNR